MSNKLADSTKERLRSKLNEVFGFDLIWSEVVIDHQENGLWYQWYIDCDASLLTAQDFASIAADKYRYLYEKLVCS